MGIRVQSFAMVVAAAALGLGQAANAQDAPPRFFFEGDMVRGTLPGMTAVAPVCVLASQFKRNEAVVWRVRVLDPKTGRFVDDKGLKNLVITLPDGQKFEGRYGPHPRGKKDDFFWTAAWKVPDNYPTGTLSYKVVATDLEGRATTWEPFKSAPSYLTIIQ